MTRQGRVLGIDLGSRRIGAAITDSEQTVATGVTTLVRGRDREADHRSIRNLVDEYEAVGVVVGVPLSLSGELGPAARHVLDEVDEIRARVGVEVETVDERLTTVAAAGRMRAAGVRSREQRGRIDQEAAAQLLQTWVDRRRSTEGAGR